jgi:hypothetical protein
MDSNITIHGIKNLYDLFSLSTERPMNRINAISIIRLGYMAKMKIFLDKVPNQLI